MVPTASVGSARRPDQALLWVSKVDPERLAECLGDVTVRLLLIF